MYGGIFSTVSGSKIISLRVNIDCFVVYLKNLSASQNAVHQNAASDRTEYDPATSRGPDTPIYRKPTTQPNS
jgi:hypothetical protein